MVADILKTSLDKGKKFLKKKQESIVSAAFVMMVLLALTKLTGFVKLHIFARFFGASRELDIFWAALTVPDMVFNIVAVGTINAALIPSFVEKIGVGKDSRERLNKMFSSILQAFMVIFSVSGIIIFIFAPGISRLLVRGGGVVTGRSLTEFTQSDIDMLTSLTRIMVISPILLGVSSVFTAGLQVNKRFIIPSLAPLFYNVGIILGTVLFEGVFGWGGYGLAWGVVLGSILHLLIQVPLARSLGLRYRFVKKLFNKDVRDIVKLGLPRIFALIGEQIGLLVNTVVSMGLVRGALSAFKFASSLHLYPVQLLGQTIAQAALPTLSSEYESSGKKLSKRFGDIFSKSLQQILYFILPAVVFVVVLRLPIVRLSLGAGEFDWTDTVMTSWVLSLFSLAIVMQAVVALVIRTFYAMHDTKTPLIATFISLIVLVFGSIYLTNFFSHYYDWRPIFLSIWRGSADPPVELFSDILRWFTTRNSSIAAVGGLALSIGFSLTVETLILVGVLSKRIKVFTWRGFYQPLLKKFLASAVMFFVMYSVFKLWNFSLDTSTVISIFLLFVVVGGLGLLVYFGLSLVIDIREVNFFIALIKKGVKRVRKVFGSEV